MSKSAQDSAKQRNRSTTTESRDGKGGASRKRGFYITFFTINVLVFIGSAIWLYFDPGFEPIIGLLASFLAFTEFFTIRRKRIDLSLAVAVIVVFAGGIGYTADKLFFTMPDETKIAVRVADNDGTSITRADVLLFYEGDSYRQTTDANGLVTFIANPNYKDARLIVEADEYQVYEETVTLARDQSKDITLSRADADNQTVIFRVVDSTNQAPISNAKVVVLADGDVRETFTDDNGIAKFALHFTETQIDVRLSVTAEDSDITNQNLTLLPNTVQDVHLDRAAQSASVEPLTALEQDDLRGADAGNPADPNPQPAPLDPLQLTVVCPESIEFGQTAECSIDTAAQVHKYTFDATTNDQLLIRLNKVSGDLYPRVSVQDPNGNETCSDTKQTTINILPCSINISGTYQIAVDDYYTEQTGKYRLYIQRLNNVGFAQIINFGQPTQGEIGAVAKVDTYTFSASINDQIWLRLNKTAGSFYPAVNVYNSAGDIICGDSDDPTAAVACSITETGQYAILVDDYYKESTGTYNLFFQRINNPGNAQAFNNGETVTGAIDAVAGFDTLTFVGKTSEVVNLTLSRTSGTFYPRIRVFDPSGTLICQDSDDPSAEIRGCDIKIDGDYTLIIDDYYAKRVGNYTVTLEKT